MQCEDPPRNAVSGIRDVERENQAVHPLPEPRLTVAPKNRAIMAGRREPPIWLRYGHIDPILSHVSARSFLASLCASYTRSALTAVASGSTSSVFKDRPLHRAGRQRSRELISFETIPRSMPRVSGPRSRAEQLVASFIFGTSGCPTATAPQSCCCANRRRCSHDSRSARLSQGKCLENFRRVFWCPTHCHRPLAPWPLLALP